MMVSGTAEELLSGTKDGEEEGVAEDAVAGISSTCFLILRRRDLRAAMSSLPRTCQKWKKVFSAATKTHQTRGHVCSPAPQPTPHMQISHHECFFLTHSNLC